MDVQGSQYHLLHGFGDWSLCLDTASGLTLGALGVDQPRPVPQESSPSDPGSAWEYDDQEGWLRLRRDTPLFRRAGRSAALDPAGRRGAGRDGYGNWYWIDTDRRSIRWRPVAEHTADLWWSVDELHSGCTCAAGSAVPGASFANLTGCPASGAVLSGLAMTTFHYLVTGYVGDGEAGLLLFDLQAGGAPLRLVWPADQPFAPQDLCDLADGGVLVLDAEHSGYVRLDEHFRLRGEETARAGVFAAADDSDAGPAGTVLRYPQPSRPRPYTLAGAAGTALHPVSIEPGPGGSVLVLDADPAAGYSTLYCFDGEVLRWETPLRDVVEVIDPSDATNTSQLYSVLGYDFVYLVAPPATGPLPAPMLYVADSEGDQVVAFALDEDTGELVARDEFLPMRRWAGRALVRSGEGAWYDFGERWVPLAVFTQCQFPSEATLVTEAPTGEVPGESFDSRIPGCVWHRLLLDAFVPTGTWVTLRARASDNLALLPIEPWVAQPVPYLRGAGAELAWRDVWADHRSADTGLPDGMGTYELLVQRVTGRYLQLEVSIGGGGRSSPALQSLRAWYPRFSYAEHYLPAVYTENDGPDRFLERFLANPEGILTAVEERIEHTHLILDPRTARQADLPWLASWFGLALDPLWTEERRRFLIRNIDAFYRRRGTVAGLVAMLRVFFDDTVDESTIFAVGAVPATGSRMRLVERFLTRDVGPAVGPATDGARVRRAAHRFDVQVPNALTPAEVEMVARIVEQGKPAHTWFALQAYEELFVVGRARLGLDTELAYAPRFAPTVLGQTRLGRGYLGHQRPFDITERVVSDRDRLGSWPAL